MNKLGYFTLFDGSSLSTMEHYGERGIGTYSQRAKSQRACADMVRRHVIGALGKLKLPCHGPLVLCDYGSADGSTSTDLLGNVIESVRSQDRKQQVQIYYEDVYNADFLSLFNMIKDNKSCVCQYDNVFFAAIGRTFLEQCLPSNSLHFGISTTAMHWLATLPCKMKRSILFNSPLCSKKEYSAYRDQAAEEWALNMEQRQKELAPGGRMVITVIEQVPNNHTSFLLEEIWSSYVKQEKITEEEFVNTNVPVFFQSHDQIRAPFLDNDGLKLKQLTSFSYPCPFIQEFQKMAETDLYRARKECAAGMAEASRAYMYGLFMKALSPARSMEEKERIVDQLFQDEAKLIEADPRKYTSHLYNHVLEICKPY